MSLILFVERNPNACFSYEPMQKCRTKGQPLLGEQNLVTKVASAGAPTSLVPIFFFNPSTLRRTLPVLKEKKILFEVAQNIQIVITENIVNYLFVSNA